MAISKARKDELMAQYVELLSESNAIFLTDYTGMGVKELETLRTEVRKAEGSFHITKNTLMRYALEQTGNPVPTDLLQGQTAAGFAVGEAPTLAKAFVDYAKKEDKFIIKGGIFDNKMLTAADVEALASMPSLDQLRGQIIGLISAPAQGIVSAVANSVRQVINVLDAYVKQEESDEEASE